MGVILKGHDEDLGRDIAVKVLHTDLAERTEALQRFVEEAQIGGQLQHPDVVPVCELGLMADERPYLTMKLVKGGTLASHLEEKKSETDRRRLPEIFESVCQAMAYAHSRGVIHQACKQERAPPRERVVAGPASWHGRLARAPDSRCRAGMAAAADVESRFFGMATLQGVATGIEGGSGGRGVSGLPWRPWSSHGGRAGGRSGVRFLGTAGGER